MARLNQHVLINTASEEIQFRGSKIECNNERKRLNKIFGKNSFRVEAQNNREWKLVCTLRVKWATKFSFSHEFYGATKKECIGQAKAANRYGRNYLKEWDIVETD